VAEGDMRLNGSIVDVDADTGRATAIRRLCIRDSEL
jgi:calcineurin-like phosphoesterase